MDGKSLNLTDEKLAQLKELFPEVFSENKVDFARLKEVLGETVVDPKEHYELSWAGKAEARREIQKQTTATLIPDKEGSINFGETENIFIEGENLEVLRILQKSYFGKVKMIYIDPPYNTGNDSFVYPDDYSERKDEYNKRAGVTDEEGYLNKQDLWRKNTRENGQFHSVWLSMMYPRLYLARNLLREDGLLFISIDDHEVDNLKKICSEIFGEENFVAQLIWNLRSGSQAGLFTGSHEYILCYAREINKLSYFEDKSGGTIRHGALKKISSDNPRSQITFPAGIEFEGDNAVFSGELGDSEKEFIDGEMVFKDGKLEKPVTITAGWGMRNQILSWINGEETFDSKGQKVTKFFFNSQGILWYEKERGTFHPKTVLPDEVGNTKTGSDEVYKILGLNAMSFPKPSNLIKFFINTVTQADDIVMDFFAGSGTTAHAVLNLNEEDGGNRKFICVQMPEVLDESSETYKAGYRSIADISKARITKVVEKLQKARAEQLALESKQVLGFNAFTLAPSNFKNWHGDVEGDALLKQLDYFRQSQKDGSLTENMLYELLLKSGLSLTTKIEPVKVGKQTAYMVEDGKLFVFFEAFDKSIKEFIHEKSPKHVVCLDSVFKSKDEDLSNFKLELSEANIELTII